MDFRIYNATHQQINLQDFDEKFCKFASREADPRFYEYWFICLEAPLRNLARIKEAKLGDTMNLDKIPDSHTFSNKDIARMTLFVNSIYSNLIDYLVLYDFWMAQSGYTVVVRF